MYALDRRELHDAARLNYRAILEGLAYALREGGERIRSKSKIAVASLRVSGGGSQSDAAMRATADIFNLPTSRPAHIRDVWTRRGYCVRGRARPLP